jgi:dihydroorotate dehydrogenase electron transfer subunit
MLAVARSQYEATVSANQKLCREHYRLSLHLDEFPPTEPGQFIQIACRDLAPDDCAADSADSELTWSPGHPPQIHGRELLGPLAVLRRPFSLAGRSDSKDGVTLEIIHRVVGVGTDWMGRLNLGDRVGIIGPLGNRFVLPAHDRPALLVGGGVGIPPMLYLAEALANHPAGAVAFCGVTTADLLPLKIIAKPDPAGTPVLCTDEFARHHIPTVISSDDGAVGRRGLVTHALQDYLDRTNSHPLIFTCGPEPMMKAVGNIALARGCECQVAVERAMACGMGTCQSCVIRVKATGRPDGRTWVYRLACTDGPVFQAADLLW